MNHVDQAVRTGIERLHLLISSPGGNVFHGLSLYNYLKGIPIDVTTHNFGTVDSIGVIMFCAGKERLSVPHARFLIHGVSAQFPQGTALEELQLEERLKALKSDVSNIAGVISQTTGKSDEDIRQAMHDRTTLSATQAKEWNLVTKVESTLFPVGATVVSIQPSIQQTPVETPGTLPPPPAPQTPRPTSAGLVVGPPVVSAD